MCMRACAGGDAMFSCTNTHTRAHCMVPPPETCGKGWSWKFRQRRGHALNAQSSRSHAIITLHVNSWATAGSAEDADAEQGEQLLQIVQRARALLHGDTSDAVGEGDAAAPLDLPDAGEPALPDAQRHNNGPVSVEPSSAAINADGTSAAHVDQSQNSAAGHNAAHDAQGQHSSCGATERSKAMPEVRRMKRYGKLVLVDLAGSERLKATGSEGVAAVAETGAINRSLFALGQVLHALSARKPGTVVRRCLPPKWLLPGVSGCHCTVCCVRRSGVQQGAQSNQHRGGCCRARTGAIDWSLLSA